MTKVGIEEEDKKSLELHAKINNEMKENAKQVKQMNITAWIVASNLLNLYPLTEMGYMGTVER